MSLYVLSAHRGTSFETDPSSHSSLEGFRSWVSRETSIPVARLILMNAKGRQVKFHTLQNEHEIFVYDRRILSTSPSADLSDSLINTPSFTPSPAHPPPDDPTSPDTLQGWQTLFKQRRAWAIEVADQARTTANEVSKLSQASNVVQRGIAIAVDNVQQHLANLRPKYEETKAWADRIRDDQIFLLGQWSHILERLDMIAVSQDLAQCLQGGFDAMKERSGKDHSVTLQALVDAAAVRKAGASGDDLSQKFGKCVSELSSTYDDIVHESEAVNEDFRQIPSLVECDLEEQVSRLLEEIEVLARKINGDYENILGLPDSPNSLSLASKTSHLHKTNFVTSLEETRDEINQLLDRGTERKRHVGQVSIRILQQISLVESDISSVHTKLASLDVDPGASQIFDLLNFVIKLPSVYGSLMTECVRRKEWTDKMTADSSSLAEEIATYKDEEAKRRKKWLKDMGGAVELGSMDDMALGIEVNLHGQNRKWPNVSRDDITKYTDRMREIKGLDNTLREIEQYQKTLDAPSKQQARRMKAFKNGSIHEATYGRTSLLLRGDDEAVLAIRTEKTKVEEKLKSAESRVRKLEDLLHRQSQMPRPVSAGGFASSTTPTFERYTTTPATNFTSALSKARDAGSRKSSFSSRRLSSNAESDEKSLAKRIVSLEAELVAQRTQSKDLERNAVAKQNAEENLKHQIQEAISTKEDLLGNFEAQQREFDDERRLLEEENNKLKIKLEELEDEFDHVLESQHDDKIHGLQEEIDMVKRDAAEEIRKANDQTELLRNDNAQQGDKIHELKQELDQRSAQIAEVETKSKDYSSDLQRRNDRQTDHRRSLRCTLLHMSDGTEIPEDFDDLIEKVELVAEKSAAQNKQLQDALETLKADNAALEARLKSNDEEIYDLRERLGSEERTVFSLREELDGKMTQCASLQTKLDFINHEHEGMKTRLATGEKDSDILKGRISEGEGAIADLLSKITETETQRDKITSQSAEKEANLGNLRKISEERDEHRKIQSSRADIISTRLHAQIQSLRRLLDQIGLMITKQDDRMVIQKVPKTGTASTTLNDLSTSMKRSLSGPMAPTSELEPLVETHVLHWATSEDSDNVARQYDDFVKAIEAFEMDVFNDAVYKRVKDIDHIARKWQREARAYRDKAQRAHTEANERIALRSFKEGDLALFLPTRDQATKPWAAFNVGAPHYFLREQDSHKLDKRDWLIARISKVEERVVDLSRSSHGGLKPTDQRSLESGVSLDDENPYELSDGLRWYLLDAAEEKPGAPINVGLGKSTVASANVDAKGSSVRIKKPSDANAVSKTLARSLDSRRSSSNSKKSLLGVAGNRPTSPAMVDGDVDKKASNQAPTEEGPIISEQEAAAAHQAQQNRIMEVPPPYSPPPEQGPEQTKSRSLAASPTKSLRSLRATSSRSPQKKPTTSPEKPKTKAWDSLWSLDVNLESSGGGGGGKGRK